MHAGLTATGIGKVRLAALTRNWQPLKQESVLCAFSCKALRSDANLVNKARPMGKYFTTGKIAQPRKRLLFAISDAGWKCAGERLGKA